ncbi:MAG: hypothetical protein P4N59_25755 [Negativicutes bacterium]|nr:hypothetical protein [Negativicutes bacterium]
MVVCRTYVFLVALALMCVGSFAASSTYIDDFILSRQEQAAAEKYRIFLIDHMSNGDALGIAQNIYGQNANAEEVSASNRRLYAKTFVKGAIPFGLPNETAALYNPFCDIFLVFVLGRSAEVKTFTIKGVIGGGGEELAQIEGITEPWIGHRESGIANIAPDERVTTRKRMLVEILSKMPVGEFAKEVSARANRSSLATRYAILSSRMTPMSALQKDALQLIARALESGTSADLKTASEIRLRPNLAGEWPPGSRGESLDLVLGTGTVQQSEWIFEARDDPRAAWWVQTSEAAGTIAINGVSYLAMP